MPQGKVKWFSTEKAYGFIEQDNDNDIFVHVTGLAEGVTAIDKDMVVEYEVEQGRKGPQATKVRPVDRVGSGASSADDDAEADDADEADVERRRRRRSTRPRRRVDVAEVDDVDADEADDEPTKRTSRPSSTRLSEGADRRGSARSPAAGPLFACVGLTRVALRGYHRVQTESVPWEVTHDCDHRRHPLARARLVPPRRVGDRVHRPLGARRRAAPRRRHPRHARPLRPPEPARHRPALGAGHRGGRPGRGDVPGAGARDGHAGAGRERDGRRRRGSPRCTPTTRASSAGPARCSTRATTTTWGT